MASQGVWFVSFLVYGVLFQVSKGGLVGYHLISNGERQQKTQQFQVGLQDGITTTDSSKTLNVASSAKGPFMSKLIPGLESNTSQTAEYQTSSWNQTQHKNRTMEPSLSETNRLNTTDVPGGLVPVTKSKDSLTNKSVLGQDTKDVINPGNDVIDGGRGGQQYMPLNKHQDLATSKPQLGAFDRINTTDASYIYQPVTSKQSNNRTTTEPLLPIIEELSTSSPFEEFDASSTIQALNESVTDRRTAISDKLYTPDAFEEFEPETNNQTQTRTKTVSQLLVFDQNVTKNRVFEPDTENQPQNRTIHESELGVLDKTNTTDVYEETKPAEKHEVQTAAKIQLEVFDKINTKDVFEAFEPLTNIAAQNRTSTYPQIGVFEKINTTDVSEEFEPAKKTKDQNQAPQQLQIQILKKINTTDLTEEFDPETNNQAHNRTITESLLEVFEKNTTTDVFEESEPAINNQTLNDIASVTQLGVFKVINTTDVSEETEPNSNNHTQQRKIMEPEVEVFGRINTTDVPKEFEQERIYKGVVNNKPDRGQEINNDIIVQGHIILNGDKVGDASLLQNQSKDLITADPRIRSFDTVNATSISDAFEPFSNSTGVVINQSLPEQDINNNATARLENGRLRELVKQKITTLQSVESRGVDNQATQTNGSVTTKHSLPKKQEESMSKVLVQSVKRQNKGNVMAQASNSKKSGQHKGNTVIRAGKVNRNSSPKPRAQNRNNSRLGTNERANRTNITNELQSVTNLTGVVISQRVPGQEMRQDTIISGNVIMNQTVQSASLNTHQTQNETTKKSLPGSIDRINTTDDIQEKFEPSTNSTAVAINESIPEQQMENDTIFSVNSSRYIKQGVPKQNDKKGAKTTEENIRIVNKLTTKGNESMSTGQLNSSVSRREEKELAKAKNYRKKGNGTMSRLIKQGSAKLQMFESGNKTEDTRVRTVNILAARGKDLNGSAQLHSVNRKKQANEQAKAKTGRKQGNTVINPNKISPYDLSTTQPQHRATIETTPHGSFKRVNASQVTDELNLTTNSADLVMNQSIPGQEMNNNTFILAQNISILGNVSDAFLSTNQTRSVTNKESNLEPFHGVNTTDDIVDLESVASSKGLGINELGSEKIRKDALFPAQTSNIRENASDASLSQNRTTNESSLGSIDRFKTSDDIEELESMANSTGVGVNESISGQQIRKDALFSGQTISIRENGIDMSLTQNISQNQTTKESHGGAFYRVNTTDNIEELESMAISTRMSINESGSEQIPKNALFSAPIINIRENVSDASLSQTEIQNRTTNESSHGSFDRLKISDDIEELESMVNSTSVGINESISGRQIRKDALFSVHTISIRENDIDTSLTQNMTQNQTTKESHGGPFYRVNTTDKIEELESVANSTGVGVIKPLSGRQIQKDALFSENENKTTLTKQIVSALQAAERGDNQANVSVRIATTLVVKNQDSKGPVKLHSTIRNKQGNTTTKARNKKKQGRRKGTDDKRSKQ